MSAWPFWLFVIFVGVIFGAIIYSAMSFVSAVFDHITAPPPRVDPPKPTPRPYSDDEIQARAFRAAFIAADPKCRQSLIDAMLASKAERPS
jgi:hypothetical protein